MNIVPANALACLRLGRDELGKNSPVGFDVVADNDVLIARFADDLMRESFRRPDIAEGLNSFAERRPPAFAPLGPLEPERV